MLELVESLLMWFLILYANDITGKNIKIEVLDNTSVFHNFFFVNTVVECLQTVPSVWTSLYWCQSRRGKQNLSDQVLARLF